MEADKLVRGSWEQGEVDALLCGLCRAKCERNSALSQAAELNGSFLRPSEQWRPEAEALSFHTTKSFLFASLGKRGSDPSRGHGYGDLTAWVN